MSKTRIQFGTTLAHVGRAAFLAAVLAGMLPSASCAAETYQYIITPGYDPAAASLVDSSSAASAAVSVAIGVHSSPAAASPLEARFRTWLESLGRALRSDRFRGIMLKIK